MWSRFPTTHPSRGVGNLARNVLNIRLYIHPTSFNIHSRFILATFTTRVITMPYLAHISLIVRDYDEAIAFYARLGFTVVEDTFIPEQQKRWVLIQPPTCTPQPSSTSTVPESEASRSPLASSEGASILLARASNTEQETFIGNQAGGRVFLFLATDDFDRDYKLFSDAGVEWVRPPMVEAYGKVAVWKDLYGNLWDLVQHY